MVIFSKIYFLYKNILAGISVIKILFFPAFFSSEIHPSKSFQQGITKHATHNGLKAKQTMLILDSTFQKNYAFESEIEKVMKGYGLIDIQDFDTTVSVKLQYATTNNFLGKNIYKDLSKAYLQKDVAEKLHRSSVFLKKTHHSYQIVILDAARPLSLQKTMWDEVKVANNEKEKFVANPIYGSLHNYAAAVDVTISDSSGKWLDMGTIYDSFDNLSYPVLENDFLKAGKLTLEQVNNRTLLRTIMSQSGFSGIETEWWHFNSCTREYAKKHYSIILSHILAENPLLISSKNIAQKIEITEPNISNINFRVQIMTSAKPLKGDESLFKQVKVERYFHNGLYKYTSGNYKTLEDAYKQLIVLQNIGFSDAFIVAFNKNTRICIKDASEFLN